MVKRAVLEAMEDQLNTAAKWIDFVYDQEVPWTELPVNEAGTPNIAGANRLRLLQSILESLRDGTIHLMKTELVTYLLSPA